MKRPDVWLLRTDKMKGVADYACDISRIEEALNQNSAYMFEVGNNFRLECMKCIKLEDAYGERESCENCIFSDNCREV